MQVERFKGLVPNVFTMGNVVCGFLAILSGFEGQITTACWLIILGAFLDGLDGKIARLSGTTSQLGVELDSLADFLTFGVAPAIIVYIEKLQHLGKWGWIISIVYIMASSYRLARFNLLADTAEKKSFIGLPTPAAATTMVAYIIFSYYLWGGLEYGDYLVMMIILFAVLMISQIEYDPVPDSLSNRANRLKILLMVAAGIILIINPRLLLFPILALYIIIGIVRELYRFYYLGVDFVKRRQTKDRDETE
jgi:CDP-diacylglycerol--serine O-phosphatidyltransferase